jgi:putative two-component system response regulator
MVTALTEKKDRLRALESGANGFISKPVDMDELAVRLKALLKFKEDQDRIRLDVITLKAGLEKETQTLEQVLEDLDQAEQRANQAHEETIRRLTVAAEARDDDTGLHIQRVGLYAAVLAEALGLSRQEVQMLFTACPMHDVGKIGIPDRILFKPEKLSSREWEIMKTHTVIGARVLTGSSSPLLKAAEVIALSHHERWDGAGYPRGLKGEQIPLSAGICAVADAFDALTSHRPYRNAVSSEQALEIILRERSGQFDPTLVDLFVERFDSILSIRSMYSETKASAWPIHGLSDRTGRSLTDLEPNPSPDEFSISADQEPLPEAVKLIEFVELQGPHRGHRHRRNSSP